MTTTPQRDIEREAFEKEFEGKLDLLRVSWDVEYFYSETGFAWDGWQARAAQATAEPVALWCSKCGVDRSKEFCPREHHHACGFIGTAYATPASAPSDGAADARDAWISVDERLPGAQGQDSEEVLCFLSGHCGMLDMECRQGAGWGIRLGYYDAERGMFRTHGRLDDSVTHWQSLPVAPLASTHTTTGGEND